MILRNFTVHIETHVRIVIAINRNEACDLDIKANEAY